MAQQHTLTPTEVAKAASALANKSLDDLRRIYENEIANSCPPYPPGYRPGTNAGCWHTYGDAANPWIDYSNRASVLELAIDRRTGRR